MTLFVHMGKVMSHSHRNIPPPSLNFIPYNFPLKFCHWFNISYNEKPDCHLSLYLDSISLFCSHRSWKFWMAVMWIYNNRILICAQNKYHLVLKKKTNIFIYFAICYHVFELHRIENKPDQIMAHLQEWVTCAPSFHWQRVCCWNLNHLHGTKWNNFM